MERSHTREHSHASRPNADHKVMDFEPDIIIKMRLVGNVHECKCP